MKKTWSVATLISLFAGWGLLAAGPAASQGAPSQVGRWESPIAWPIVAIHAAVLPTGKVFNVTYLDPITEGETAATLWNPSNRKFTDVSPGFGNMFCSGQSFLADGRVFITGGLDPDDRVNCAARGVREMHTFDPFDESWQQLKSMRSPRFYPTNLVLPDGKQLIIGGQGEYCQYIPTMELFDPVKGGISRVQGPNRIMRDYPRAFLLSTGEVVHVAPEPTVSVLDPKRKHWISIAVTRLGRPRWEGAAFYLPGSRDTVMICGGYLERSLVAVHDPTATCEVIDFTNPAPAWRQVSSMNFARGDLNAVLLPDGTVLVVGGGEEHRYDAPVLRPEIYDPASDRWTVVPGQRYGRMYHSTAVLLPDGRVLSAGQDDGKEDGRTSGAWGEVYNPPYLFRGRRPIIRAAPEFAEYGSALELEVSRAARLERVVLMGLSAVTHATNVGQRYVPLDFAVNGRRVTAEVPENPALLPPGYYMLFAVRDNGVPSEAAMIRIVPWE